MTQTEYKQKRSECWEKFKRENLDGEVQWQPVSRYDVFCDAFDRAYALGREKETITQEEIGKAAREYSDSLGKSRDVTWSDAENGFIAGANFALGKQEKDAEDTVISGWVARDEDENLFMYNTKPERDETIHMWMGKCADIDLRNHLFPNLTWDDDPQDVEIIIKRKKK